jgi:hypothetical protein
MAKRETCGAQTARSVRMSMALARYSRSTDLVDLSVGEGVEGAPAVAQVHR